MWHSWTSIRLSAKRDISYQLEESDNGTGICLGLDTGNILDGAWTGNNPEEALA